MSLQNPYPRLPSLPDSKYALGKDHTIPARSGVAVPLPKDHTITVTNTHGTQVIDFWFLSPTSTPPSALSMCHSRASTLHLTPRVGDTLVSNHRLPMLQLDKDTTPMGIHDTLIAACDLARYRQLGVPDGEYHESCTDNFKEALRRDVAWIVGEDVVPPDPLNLFMNIPVDAREEFDANDEGYQVRNRSVGAEVAFERPVCGKGDLVVLRALVGGVVVMSACPQDILRINDNLPVEAGFRVDGP